MFTGIITEVGEVVRYTRRGGGGRLAVAAAETAAALAVGGSVAVEGVCVTVAERDGAAFEADLSAETVAQTTLGALRPGEAVNLELPAAAGAPLGGHLVQGHVDGVGRIGELRPLGEGYELRVTVGPEVGRYVVEKGSVAVAGISLTAIDVSATKFAAAIIPHTYENTTLRRRRAGDTVNVEVDVIAKYVERFLSGRPGGVTAERLAELGFGE
jgi:riboflavin synthase